MTGVTDEELVQLFRDRLLAQAMADRFVFMTNEGEATIRSTFARLHNAKAWDLLALVDRGELQALDGSSFFAACHLLNEVVPELDVDPGRLMDFTEALVTHGGDDLAASMPNAALRAWCAKDPARSEAILAMAEDGDPRATRALTFPLEALGDPSRARAFLVRQEPRLRLSAATALARMPDPDPVSQASTLSALGDLAHVQDGLLKAALFTAAIHVLGQPNATMDAEALRLIERLLDTDDDQVVHAATHAIWADPVARDDRILSRLLAVARTVNPANKGTLKELDLALRVLLEGDGKDAALEFAEAFFTGDGEVELQDLQSFVGQLVNGDSEVLAQATCRWLLIGNPRLCKGLSAALNRGEDSAPRLDLSRNLQPLSGASQIFVCRKAIAWFFIKPRTAASVLVSCLRVCDSLTRREVQALLIHPLLINYSGVRDYLTELPSDDPAKAAVDAAVAEGDAYIEGLRGVPELRAFFPNEHQRRVQQLRRADQSREIAQQARKQSVFFNLVKRSVILYGRRSLSYQRGPDGDLQRFEMELKPHGVEFEFPRMEIVDPIGLDYLLRLYRTEALVE